MDEEFQKLVEELFHEATALPPDQREEYLNAACEDPGVRAEVDSLLAYLDSRKLHSLNSLDDSEGVDADLIGQYIGPYKLDELIGEGGFGAVYLARQERPVKRSVAIKIIKLGMDTKQVVARFEAEQQALAMMEHPNIARVFDAGATESGRSYFVMEHVRGAPITEYCDDNRCTIEQRLELMITVCRALQHAHQKGVIHRDIKPGNVLVTLQDGAPTAKIIDFGVAKALHESLTNQTRLTRQRQFIGTPEYVSPEQADLNGADVDTRGDVYSLGALLYELLTGTTPCNARSLSRVSYTEMLRLIREETPEAPSKRVATDGNDSRETAETRGIEWSVLPKALRGDLDWIVLKALEKDRDRRYESAAALAYDIQRHLRNEPVSAGPPGKAYQMRKLAARHKAAFAAGATLLLTLAVFSTWMGVLYTEADMLREQAEQQRMAAELNMARAQKEATTTRDLAQVLATLLEAGDPMRAEGRNAAREMLATGVRNINETLSEQPEIQGALLDIVGRVYTNLGLYEQAEEALRRALHLRRECLGDAQSETIGSMTNLGHALMYGGQLSEAEALLREAVARGSEALGAEHPQTVQATANLAWTLQARGHYAEAEPLCRSALENHRRLYGNDDPKTIAAINALSWLLQHVNAIEEALSLSEEALATSARVFGRENAAAAESMNILGMLNLQLDRPADSAKLFREATDIRRRLLGRDHPETLESVHNLAWALSLRNAWAEAEACYREALTGYEHGYGADSSHAAECMCHLAMTLVKQGKKTEAERYLNMAAPAMQRELDELETRPLNSTLIWLDVREEQRRLGNHEALIREILDRHRAAFGDSAPRTIGFSLYLVNALLQEGRAGEAEAIVRRAIELTRKRGDEAEGPCEGCLTNLLGECLAAEGRYAEAEEALLAGVKAVAEHHGARHTATRQAIERLAALYEGQNRTEDAAAWRAKLAD